MTCENGNRQEPAGARPTLGTHAKSREAPLPPDRRPRRRRRLAAALASAALALAAPSGAFAAPHALPPAVVHGADLAAGMPPEQAPGCPAHLAGDPGYVLVREIGNAGLYLKKSTLQVVRLMGSDTTHHELRAEAVRVEDALLGGTEPGEARLYRFRYDFGPGGRRLRHAPPDKEAWSDVPRGAAGTELRAVGEMAYYLVFGKPFYGYLAGFGSEFYAASAKNGVRGTVLAARDGRNLYYLCPGTVHNTADGLTAFVKIGPSDGTLREYIMDFALLDGRLYYAFYRQGKQPAWQPLADQPAYRQLYRLADHYRDRPVPPPVSLPT